MFRLICVASFSKILSSGTANIKTPLDKFVQSLHCRKDGSSTRAWVTAQVSTELESSVIRFRVLKECFRVGLLCPCYSKNGIAVSYRLPCPSNPPGGWSSTSWEPSTRASRGGDLPRATPGDPGQASPNTI